MNRTSDRWTALLGLLFSAFALSAQNTPQASGDAAEDSGMAAPKDAWQGAWSVPETQRSATTWKAASTDRPTDVNARFNWFRSERNARSSRNNGRLLEQDNAELAAIAEGIRKAAPGSFEQHLIDYYTAFPQPAAFVELEAAYAREPQRAELILPMLVHAELNGDKAGMDRWCAQLEQRGDLAPALTRVAEDLLLSIGKDGILFTNGDMDGAPALVLQRLHDQRRDVLLVDQRLLEDANYRQRIWKEARASGPVPASGPVFARTLATNTQRPVYLAMSLDRSWFASFPGKLHATGIAFVVGEKAPDSSLLAERWGRMNKPTNAGPLSHNYLLPGAVLLHTYRTIGDEARASRMEYELRGLATKLGATQDLIKAGVLAH